MDKRKLIKRIQKLREVYDMSLADSKSIVENYDFRKEIDKAESVGDLKYVLDRLIDHCFERYGFEDEKLEEIWNS